MSSDPRTATFLFTGLEGSTPLWENHPAVMQGLAARHDTLIRETIEAHRDRVVKKTGDGLHAVFDAATDGVAASNACEQANMLSTALHEVAELAQAMEPLAEALGKERQDKALAEGWLMSLDDAVMLALDETTLRRRSGQGKS